MTEKIQDPTRPRTVVARQVSDLLRYRVEQQICVAWMRGNMWLEDIEVGQVPTYVVILHAVHPG